MNAKTATQTGTGARPASFTLPVLLSAAWRWSLACAARRRQRLALAELDDRLLGDIGLTRGDIRREAGKYPWMR